MYVLLGVARMVERLLSKSKAPSSNPSPTKIKKKKLHVIDVQLIFDQTFCICDSVLIVGQSYLTLTRVDCFLVFISTCNSPGQETCRKLED
jgi:hypothetical protein